MLNDIVSALDNFLYFLKQPRTQTWAYWREAITTGKVPE